MKTRIWFLNHAERLLKTFAIGWHHMGREKSVWSLLQPAKCLGPALGMEYFSIAKTTGLTPLVCLSSVGRWSDRQQCKTECLPGSLNNSLISPLFKVRVTIGLTLVTVWCFKTWLALWWCQWAQTTVIPLPLAGVRRNTSLLSWQYRLALSSLRYLPCTNRWTHLFHFYSPWKIIKMGGGVWGRYSNFPFWLNAQSHHQYLSSDALSQESPYPSASTFIEKCGFAFCCCFQYLSLDLLLRGRPQRAKRILWCDPFL